MFTSYTADVPLWTPGVKEPRHAELIVHDINDSSEKIELAFQHTARWVDELTMKIRMNNFLGFYLRDQALGESTTTDALISKAWRVVEELGSGTTPTEAKEMIKELIDRLEFLQAQIETLTRTA